MADNTRHLGQRPRPPLGKPGQAGKAQAAPAAPVRHHWREIWDGFWHGVGGLLRAFAIYVLIVSLSAFAFMGSYYYLTSERLQVSMDVLMLLDLSAPTTEAGFSVQQAVFREAEPPPMQIDLLWKAFIGTASVIYWATVLVTRATRRG